MGETVGRQLTRNDIVHHIDGDKINKGIKMIDIIQHHHGEITPTIKCLDHGFVALWDCMPRLVEVSSDGTVTADHAVTQAARLSYQKGTKSVQEDRGLVRYLMRHQHTSPTEMIEFKLHMSMPIFVARQAVRHRTASLNEMSARYSVMPDKFYIPTVDNVRSQSKTNKQMTEGQIAEIDANEFIETLERKSDECYAAYEQALENGVGREQARMLLPVNIYTEWVWKIDCHNLLHFLKLRCDKHAQYEIRVYGEAILKLISPLVPWTVEAWNDFNPYRDAVTLTGLEVEALKNRHVLSEDQQGVPTLSNRATKREQEEWAAKAALLGFSVLAK